MAGMCMRDFMDTVKEFAREEEAVGVVEIILILVILNVKVQNVYCVHRVEIDYYIRKTLDDGNIG